MRLDRFGTMEMDPSESEAGTQLVLIEARVRKLVRARILEQATVVSATADEHE